MKYSQYFDRRSSTFLKSYEMIKENMGKNGNGNENKMYNIVELGTSRSFVTGGVDGCMNTDKKYWRPFKPDIWDWGAGIFTKVFAENLKDEKCNIYTIDPDDNAIAIVTTMCKEYKKVKICKTHSTNFLSDFNEKIDFLYMDHMETSEEAAIQHLNDIKLIFERNLMSENGIILVDDVGQSIIDGKGKYSIPFLQNNNYNIVIHDYQVLMEKNNVLV
jgi:hypothetical protein